MPAPSEGDKLSAIAFRKLHSSEDAKSKTSFELLWKYLMKDFEGEERRTTEDDDDEKARKLFDTNALEGGFSYHLVNETVSFVRLVFRKSDDISTPM